jgi:hypothetical protein
MTNNNNKNKARMPPVGGAAPTTSTPNTTRAEDSIDSTIIPLNNRKRKRYDDGLDWLRQPSNDLPSNAVSTWSEISMLQPDGSTRVMDTYSADEWHSKNEMDRRYDGRYEGRSQGYPDDPDNFSTSGLKVRSTRNNNNDSSSSGLNV